MRIYILLFLLVSVSFACRQKEEPVSTGLPFVFLDSLTQKMYLDALPEKPASYTLEIWDYAVGDPANGLQVSAGQIPVSDTVVQTPFRVNLPNTPLWFITKVQLEEDQLLYVNADDGSQVFYDGQPIFQSIPYGYHLPATPDSVTLAIRVLNNAMAGGLRKAEFFSFEAGVYYFTEREKMYRADTSKTILENTLLQNGQVLLQKRNGEKAGSNFSFTAWGDSQGGWKTFRQLSKDMAQQNSDFSIGLGDLVADGSSLAQWQGFLYALAPLRAQTPIFPVIGNHDYDGYYDDLIPQLYLNYMASKTYFAWTYKNARFVALDPNKSFPLGIKDVQREWLFAEITNPAWQEADWRFLLLHQPPYSAGWPGYHGDDFIRKIIDQYAESAQIDFVLSGHSHCYERLTKNYGDQQTHFIILGGAGGGLEPPEDSDYPKMDTIIKAHHYGLFKMGKEQVDLQIIGLEEKILDQHTFRKGISQ